VASQLSLKENYGVHITSRGQDSKVYDHPQCLFGKITAMTMNLENLLLAQKRFQQKTKNVSSKYLHVTVHSFATQSAN